MAEQMYHVLSLTVRQQAAVRLMLFNLFANFIRKSMEDLQDFLYSEEGSSRIQAKYHMIIENLEKYDDFTDVFCSRQQTARAETRMITLSSEAMRHIQLAMKGFDRTQCHLGAGDVQYVISEFDKLKKLVEQSSQFMYSSEEIKRGGK
jgi:hypothetical protein